MAGDVVVFPGATLTIEAGTKIKFLHSNLHKESLIYSTEDRHQFTAPGSRDGLIEIFVYGTLEAKGTSSNPVVFSDAISAGALNDGWGGIRLLRSGSADLGTYISHNTDPAKPRLLGSSSGEGWASVRYDHGGDPVISGYQTRMSADGGTTWTAWSNQALLAGQMAYEYREEGLREGTDYWLSVRSVNKAPQPSPLPLYPYHSDTLLVKITTLGTEDPGEVVLEPTSPGVGQAVTATLTDADGYIAGSVWTWERKPVDGTTWTTLIGSEDTAESSVYTPIATDLDQVLRVTVSYRDGHGTNTDTAESDLTAAVAGTNAHAPTISGPDSVSYVENATVDVGTYTARDADGHQIRWLTLDGADKDAFVLTGADTDATRTLQFATAPNFEQQQTYDVLLRVRDRPNEPIGQTEDPNPPRTTELPVTVAIRNAEDVGELVLQGLTSAPIVGTALVAQLTDEDGNITLTSAGWQWQRKQPDETTWANITAVGSTADSPPEMHSYTPTSDDIDHLLRVQVSYTDGYGGKEKDVLASAATTGVVTGSDRPPTLNGKPVVSMPENTQRVGEYTAGDPDGDPVTWLVLTGPDHTAFELTGRNDDAERTLQFKADALPNFESAKTRYEVLLTVESTPGSGGEGAASTSAAASAVGGANGVPRTALAVTVDITNAEDAGTLVLSPLPPKVGVPLTATLEDEDGSIIGPGPYGAITGPQWQWHRRAAPGRWWFFSSSSRPFSPPASHVGLALRVAVLYVDGYGPAVDTTWSAVTAPIAASNHAPVVSGASAPSVWENTTAVGAYTATDADGDAITWSLGPEKDEALFTLDAAGHLAFVVAPDYEALGADHAGYMVDVVASDGTAQTSYPVKVTVADVEEAGIVTVRPATPQVDVLMQATLSDPDGGATSALWHWIFADGVSGMADTLTVAPAADPTVASTRTPQAEQVDQTLRVGVSYRDRRSSGPALDQYAEVTLTEPVQPKVPQAPQNPQASALSASSIELTWAAPQSNGGRSIEHYAYQQQDGTGNGSDWSLPLAGGGRARSYRVDNLTSNTSYAFRVRAENVVGASAYAAMSATTLAADRPPVLTGDPEPHIDENTTVVPGEYTATDPDGDAITWLTLTGADASAFELSGSITDPTRTLQFTSAPNFEQQPRYDVTLRVQSSPSSEGFGEGAGASGANGPRTTEFPVQVQVTDANDEGTLSLSTLQPQVGDTLTATLHDEDGVRSAAFDWFAAGAGGQSGPAPSAAAKPVVDPTDLGPEVVDVFPYGSAGVVSSEFVGLQIRVRVRYTDAHGEHTLSLGWSASVVGKPCAPTLAAEAGDGQVALAWTVPAACDNGAPIQYSGWRTDGPKRQERPDQGSGPAAHEHTRPPGVIAGHAQGVWLLDGDAF